MLINNLFVSIGIFLLEQRAAREAILRDKQMHDMFADLDTNSDSR